MELAAGQLFDGKLQVIRLIGRGAMGAVYEARHTWLDRVVALKVMTPSELNSIERFRREVTLLSSAQHPNVVNIRDAGVCGDRPYMVMELLPGCDLETLLTRQGPLDLPRALWIARSVAEALTAMHAKDVVHRDLKPPNIQILDPDAAEPRVKVLDFGISTTLRPSTKLTQNARALGTPEYMSPEQALAEQVDSRSDMYALGCVLFEMLAGRPPFADAPPMAIAAQHVHAQVPDIRRFRADVPGDVVAILRRCLQKTPQARYRATAELRDVCADAYARHAVVRPDHELPTRPISSPHLSLPGLAPARGARSSDAYPLAETVTSMPEFRFDPLSAPTIPHQAPDFEAAPALDASPRRPNLTKVDPLTAIPRGPQGTAVELQPVPRTSTPAPTAPAYQAPEAIEKTTYLRGLEFPDASAPAELRVRRFSGWWIVLLLALAGLGVAAWLVFGERTHDRVVPGKVRSAAPGSAPGTAAAAPVSAPATQAERLPTQLGQPEITEVIKANADATDACWSSDAKRPEGLELTVVIEGSGQLKSARITHPATGLAPAIRDCLVGAVKGWRFPRFSGAPMAVKIRM